MCRVLIIDDEEFSAETIKMILEGAGEATADYATTYKDARELVQQSLIPNKPYDVFLIDLRLGPGKDGIEFMQELRVASPDTDAIIFTGLEDSAQGVRAYEAGAFRYLYKPFENEELLYLLRAVKQKRKEEQEHDWQKLFTSMMEEALRKTTFLEVASVVVKYALKLGFSRAHLFWIPTQEEANTENSMIGVACAGKNCIRNFEDRKTGTKLYPLKQWFHLKRVSESHEVVFYKPGKAAPRQPAITLDYQWPKGEIAFLPLWGSNGHLGELMLDHAQFNKAHSKHELPLLNFFARQVAIVLENISLITREQRTIQETTMVSQIGRQVTGKAAEETKLSELLDEVHKQVSFLMDASNFSVVLLEPDSGRPEIGLWYENGVRQDPARISGNTEIEKFLLTRENSFFWKQNVARYLQTNDLKLEGGQVPVSCIGVPLRVGEKIIGGIVAKNFGTKGKFSERDKVLLTAVANQISGAIQLIHVNKAEKRDAERLNVLQQAMAEMLRIGQENEDHLWLTTLTIATANFGMGFNRALLFLESKEGTLLRGENGVGTNNYDAAHQDWENIVKSDYNFNHFLSKLQSNTLHYTEFQHLAQKITVALNGDNNVFTQVMKEGHYVLVNENQVSSKLPAPVREMISPATCAILPILTGKRTIGLVLVDNKHNSLPLNEKMLNHLQTLLNYSGLVWETLRQQRKSESLLDANYQIMGEARLQPLKETLRSICKTAQEFTEADWVLIYPLKEGKKYEFDRENATYIGNLKSLENVIKEKPSPNGISSHIFKAGELVVPDVNNEEFVIGDIHLTEHDFIKRERVRAMIGTAIKDVQKEELLGILYLDYRTPQDFSDLDVHHAKSFASLAAVAIANERRDNEHRHQQRLKAALETAQIINNELDFDSMLLKVLENLRKFFKKTSMCIMTYDDNANALRFVPSTLKLYQAPKSTAPESRLFPLEGPSIAARAARETLARGKSVTINIPDVRKSHEYLKIISQNLSELCVSLVSSSQKLLGVLVLERTSTYGFSNDDEALIETVASQLSLGMERTRQSEQLNFKTTVAALTSWAADIAHDINNEAGEIQAYTYLIKEFVEGNGQLLDYATKIEESAQRLFDAGPKSKQGKQVVSLDLAIRRFAEPLARQRDIQIEFNLDAREGYVEVNLTDFRRVLQHLTRNADKAMRETKEKKITIYTNKLDNEVEILFRDHGPGVPEDVQLSIFQKSVTTKQTGGYGLLLTRQFVEDMGGTIRLFPPVPGEGATFSIKLPFISQIEVNE